MRQGRIIRIISNQYEVLTADNKRLSCIAMGKLRKQYAPVVGDIVDIETFDDKIGIQRIHPRKNHLLRPAIANVDQAIIVMSAREPDFSSVLLDRLIFMVSYANVSPILCITKMDLASLDDPIHEKIEDYKKSGYPVYISGEGYASDALVEALQEKISVLCGQSGAGKSSLLNRIDPSFQLHTQKISKALGRGKHTTRHCELHNVHSGWVADTPGFSSLDFEHMDALKLGESILDFQDYLHQCKFNDCIHIHEPGCAIIQAVEEGKISKYRYEHYKEIVEIINNKRIKF